MFQNPVVMHSYSVFGGTLDSEIEIPELRPSSDSNASWTLRVADGKPPAFEAAQEVGREEIENGPTIVLSRAAATYRLSYSDTGIFDLVDRGRHIVWYRDTCTAELELVRMDVMSRVLATAFHLAGELCLHASAVVLPGGAVGFIAPKNHGKSTLAFALAHGGAKLLTDDTLPVIAGDPVRCRPGVHSVRLREESAHAFADRLEPGAWEVRSDRVITGVTEELLAHEPTPMAAIYRLISVHVPPDSPAAVRKPLHPIGGAMHILGHAKMGGLLGKDASGMDRAIAIAGRIPVYELEIVRDFARLPEVVETIAAWHAVPAIAGA